MTIRDARVTFDHREDGALEGDWCVARQWERTTATDIDELLDGRTRMTVVCAHPDDETLGCGGLMSAAAGRGLEITVIIATLGELSHPSSPTHAPDRMAERRSAELRSAIARLAPRARTVSLALPDGQVEEHEHIVEAALRTEIDMGTLVVANWRHDGHPDHEAVGHAAAVVCDQQDVQLLEYPIWAWHWADLADLPWHTMRRVDLAAGDRLAKQRALEEHVSQIAPLSHHPGDEPVLGPEFRKHFARPFETFFDAELISAKHFDRMFEDSNDPWSIEQSWYEGRKRSVTMAALPRQQFDNVLEIGCSTGILTAQLATRAHRVLAVDISGAALVRARARLKQVMNVELRRMNVPLEWPTGQFDLVVLSEVGYYWSRTELGRALSSAVDSLTDTGLLLLVHWRHPVDDRRLNGDGVHEALDDLPGCQRLVHHVEPDFRLDVVGRGETVSIAALEGRV